MARACARPSARTPVLPITERCGRIHGVSLPVFQAGSMGARVIRHSGGSEWVSRLHFSHSDRRERVPAFTLGHSDRPEFGVTRGARRPTRTAGLRRSS